MTLLRPCTEHGPGPECDCPAYLVLLGAMDAVLEQRIQTEPGFAAAVIRQLQERTNRQ